MTKTIKDFFELYLPKAKDEKKFFDKHVVAKIKDEEGNGDDVFQAKNIKTVNRQKQRHGYNAGGADAKVYEETDMLSEADKEHVTTAYDWHGGQNSPLYSFASTGGKIHSEEHRSDLKHEIKQNMTWTAKYGDDYKKLNSLLDHVNSAKISPHRPENVDESNYSKDAVDAAIASSNRSGRKIGGREAKNIHKILKGWRGADEDNKKATIKKEEVESLDEISPALAKSYLDTASKKENQPAGTDGEGIRNRYQGSRRANDIIKNPGGKNPHFQKQPREMQDAINKHLRDGKNYGEAFRCAKNDCSSTNEEVEHFDEVLHPSMGKERYISDFLNSDDPRFRDATVDERRRRALAAYYSARGKSRRVRRESVETDDQIDEGYWDDTAKKAAEEKPNLRLIKTHTNGNRTAKVYHDKDWDEHRVKFYTNGVHEKNADYHTDDRDDAHDNASSWVKQAKEDFDIAAEYASVSEEIYEGVTEFSKEMKSDHTPVRKIQKHTLYQNNKTPREFVLVAPNGNIHSMYHSGNTDDVIRNIKHFGLPALGMHEAKSHFADGKWHLVDNDSGKIHSTYSNGKKANKAMREYNDDAYYDHHKKYHDDPEKMKKFQYPFSAHAASHFHEEVEPVTEASKTKISHYVSDAANSLYDIGGRVGKLNSKALDALKRGDREAVDYNDDLATKDMDKASLRARSIKLAAKKLAGRAKVNATEEVEPIDELKKSTYGNYIKAAATDKAKARSDMDAAIAKGSSEESDDADNRYLKRTAGIKKAVNQLTKEDIINTALNKYIPEIAEYTPMAKDELLVSKLKGISESHVYALLDLFNSLTEENQSRMLDTVETFEGINDLIDFVISNRGE